VNAGLAENGSSFCMWADHISLSFARVGLSSVWVAIINEGTSEGTPVVPQELVLRLSIYVRRSKSAVHSAEVSTTAAMDRQVHNDAVTGSNPLLLTALHDLSETAPALAASILRHSSAPRDALRATNRLLRRTVNRTVETVVVALPGSQPRLDDGAGDITSDLGVTFPNATKLHLHLHMEPVHAVAANLLTHLAEASPRLLSRLQDMELNCNDSHVRLLCLTVLPAFLAR
jgi:hypothetical protein